MKGKGIFIWIILLELLLCLFSNIFLLRNKEDYADREYKVETGRAAIRIRSGDIPSPSEYHTVTEIKPFDPEENGNSDYMVAKAKDGTLYKIAYEIPENKWRAILILNISWGVMILVTILILIYIERTILKPFRDVSELPNELAKGNLSIPLKEEKNRYFGRFLWGMDMLRERLETEKADRLSLEQEKKTLILTMSHDIKTPLSAIKLYNRALSDHIYDSEEKQMEAYAGIEKNTRELEEYIDRIRDAAREDFLQIKVNDGEWYLSEVMEKTESLYREKAKEKRTEFVVEPYSDVLLKGDPERALEVLQNLLENAIKYGDGQLLRISFSDEEDCRLVTVENTGCTLPEREMLNIFDSFYRGSNSENVKGSGLGLYICRQLMRAMDGEVYAGVESGRFLVTAVFRKK